MPVCADSSWSGASPPALGGVAGCRPSSSSPAVPLDGLRAKVAGQASKRIREGKERHMHNRGIAVDTHCAHRG